MLITKQRGNIAFVLSFMMKSLFVLRRSTFVNLCMVCLAEIVHFVELLCLLLRK